MKVTVYTVPGIIYSDWSVVYLGITCHISFIVYLSIKIDSVLRNSADRNEMPHLGLTAC